MQFGGRFQSGRFSRSRLGAGAGLRGPGAAVFSPADLFAGGMQGLFLDSRASSAFFQDASGITLADPSGDPAGLLLDRSQGLARGPELVVNGDFSASTDWTAGSGATLDFSGGRLTVSADPGDGFATAWQELPSVAGQWHEVKLDFASITGQTRAGISSVSGVSDRDLLELGVGATEGERSGFYLGTGSPVFLELAIWGAGSVVAFNSASVRSVAGNHLPAPADTNRADYQSSGGLYWLDADGNDDYYLAATRFGLGADPDLTVVVALNTGIQQPGQTERVWHIGGANSDGALSAAVGTPGVSWRHNNGNRIFPAIADNTDAVVAWRRASGDLYRDGEVFIDSVQQAEVTRTNGANSPTDTGAQFSIFGKPDGGERFGGRIYAIAVFPYRLTDQQLAQVTTWMAARQGRSL